MAIVYETPKALLDVPTHYCPGCTHGVIHKLIAEVIDELEILDKTIAVAPVGCSVLMYNYFACDVFEAAHGRAPATATGIKRTNPDKVVFTYQGDGDLAAIGMAEIVHAATRGENLTSIFVNNCIYGMTGGQMAPTTLPGQITETTPYGRDVKLAGYPIRVSELISTLTGACYVERVSIDTIPNLLKAKKAIKRAFENQIAGFGFSMIEILSICPTNWGLSPQDSMKWLRDNMIPYYPLGVKKNTTEEAK
ncbi:thiamine pyrophosphate-dependent enzyme [Clostridium lacusfryxellense]|uniref:thiamine pyrophosphate-dependent enzyme n=1 Tax=Clostridium lacusfryxellense TaxID=205328 RepID=UPI001C0C77DA|nr:thiamine pyrophosphate-dependent enzyme [Clostridium lacusfryxellense]MBU3113817.1 2-oxoglutarate oxidoreductase [Clostridium lacusfryxellense]